jgi:general secretion pathway protein G
MNAPKRHIRPQTAGFTLVELMVVISIIAILATIVGINMIGQIDESNVKAAQAQIHNFKTAIIAYKLKHRTLPDSLDQLVPEIIQEGIPVDPWGNPYVYTKEGGNKFTIVSYGGDGRPGGSGTDADISSDALTSEQK